tara:strand:- start:296 stop:496 length:201 start_codon:yes stop_codon:yes gene_type:complete
MFEDEELWDTDPFSEQIEHLWDDMSKLNSLYEELCWKPNDPIEFVPDYEKNQIIIRPKKKSSFADK